MAQLFDMVKSDFEEALSKRGVEERFHALLAELCNEEPDYLADIALEDLVGCVDATGAKIAMPVARGLLRKLQQKPPSVLSGDPREVPHPDPVPALPAGPMPGRCQLSFWQGEGDLIRCEVKARVDLVGAGVRRKLLTAILDRSGSMTRHWSLLVEAVCRVVTDELLADPLVILRLVVYDGSATEVPLPSSSKALRASLLGEFAPKGGITCFSLAFQRAEAAIRGALKDTGLRAAEVDVLTLLFTDGQDTSLPPRGSPSEASTAAARSAGDWFREALRKLGCASYTVIAAFGEQHNPDMCQCLSDRYTYIDRPAVLSDWIAGGLDEMLGSGGQCTLSITAPSGAALEEASLMTLPLNPDGTLHHHFWLTAPKAHGTVTLELSVVNLLPVRADGDLSSVTTPAAGSFEESLFRLDEGALRLRKLAQELSGKRPSLAELDRIRANLIEVQTDVSKTRDAACAAAGLSRGRAAIRQRAQEVEATRDRLSYALGHFDARDQDCRAIGGVAIDAVLRDAGQQQPFRGPLLELIQQAEAIAALPRPEAISGYGRQCTLDEHSGRDAQGAAEDGDALFFHLHELRLSDEGIVSVATDGVSLITHESFLTLSQDGTQAVAAQGKAKFTHVGLPLYATPGHFLRVQLALPSVLRRLCPSTAKYEQPELVLLSVFGRGLAGGHAARCSAGAASRKQQGMAVLHKARGLQAVLKATASSEHGSLLAEICAQCSIFAERAEALSSCRDLYVVLGAILLLEWPRDQLLRLLQAVTKEAVRRSLREGLRPCSDIERLWLAWALLQEPETTSDDWPQEVSRASQSCMSHTPVLKAHGYNPLSAAEELRARLGSSESLAPSRPGVAALRAIFSKPSLPGVPSLADCVSVAAALLAWTDSCGSGGLSEIWERLDRAMLHDTCAAEDLDWIEAFAESLSSAKQAEALQAALGTNSAFLLTLTGAANPSISATNVREMVQGVAAATDAVIKSHADLVRKYPICGASFPSNFGAFSARRCQEVWGRPAVPCDEEIYTTVKDRLLAKHRWRPLSVRMALVDKEYRAKGGRFEFPGPLDTFVEGLHRRTQDLHKEWESKGRTKHVSAAVQEMLLRLRFDDRDEKARQKLALIIKNIWDGLNGLATEPVSSALWLDDALQSTTGEHSPKENEWIDVGVAGSSA